LQRNSEKKRKIGLFGGTFNPVHWGHLRSAEEIREAFNLTQVIFIPVHVPPHKKSDVASAAHRFGMVKRAIRGNRFFRASDIELQRPGKSYSIDTIRHFHGLAGGEQKIFFIIGTDAFREIYTWKDYPAFFSACNFIVMDRPGAPGVQAQQILPRDIRNEFTFRNTERCFVHISGCRIHLYSVTQLDISSTVIRTHIQQGRSIRYLVPPAVERYIAEQRIYEGAQKRLSG
jgi:nicotinate-nucleotide adenylyltransferase